jgi:hypothetical protein
MVRAKRAAKPLASPEGVVEFGCSVNMNCGATHQLKILSLFPEHGQGTGMHIGTRPLPSLSSGSMRPCPQVASGMAGGPIVRANLVMNRTLRYGRGVQPVPRRHANFPWVISAPRPVIRFRVDIVELPYASLRISGETSQ